MFSAFPKAVFSLVPSFAKIETYVKIELEKIFSYQSLDYDYSKGWFEVKHPQLIHTKFDSYPTLEISRQFIATFKVIPIYASLTARIEIDGLFICVELVDASKKVTKN